MDDTSCPYSEKKEIMMEPLTRLDRCDNAGCSAAAWSVAEWEGVGRLMFCGHHTRKHQAAMLEQGATILAPDNIEDTEKTPVTAEV